MKVRLLSNNQQTIDFAALIEKDGIVEKANNRINELVPARIEFEISPRECRVSDQKYFAGHFGILTTAKFDYVIYKFIYKNGELQYIGHEGNFRS